MPGKKKREEEWTPCITVPAKEVAGGVLVFIGGHIYLVAGGVALYTYGGAGADRTAVLFLFYLSLWVYSIRNE